jgi:NhaA family Na+:H+ antiporter
MDGTFSSRVRRVLDLDFSAAIAIGTGVVIALSWSALDGTSYRGVLDTTWSNGFLHDASLNSLHAIVVNGLMTVFFFAIGLELSRELREGELTTASHAVTPVLGALGGMAGTALLSVLVGVVEHSSALRRGWGVPMATDIAFTLGVLALAGKRLPSQIRIFLLTLAVADDAFSVVVLAFTGATHVRWEGTVALAFVVVIGVLVSRRTNFVAWPLVLLIVLWACFLWANIEPPLAGVVGGLLVTFKTPSAFKIENSMSRWSNGVVLPLFALVSCGVRWHELSLRSSTLTIIISMIVIRIVGKVVGISSGVALARIFHFRLDPSISLPLLASVSVICAIGFTVPLLFANALFGSQSATYGAYTMGLLLASLIATLAGISLLRLQTRRKSP